MISGFSSLVRAWCQVVCNRIGFVLCCWLLFWSCVVVVSWWSFHSLVISSAAVSAAGLTRSWNFCKSKLILPFWGTWFNKYYSFGFLWLTNVNSFENTTAFLESCILSFWSGILVSYYMTLCFSSFFYLIRCADCSFFHLGGEIFRLTWLNVWDSVGFLSILGDTTFRLLFLLFEKRVIFIDFRVIYIFDFVKFQKTLRSFGESAIYLFNIPPDQSEPEKVKDGPINNINTTWGRYCSLAYHALPVHQTSILVPVNLALCRIMPG